MVSKRLLQIDLIKGAAILAVVVTHSLGVGQLVRDWAVFHVWQAVPVFIVVMGVNTSLALASKGLPAGLGGMLGYWWGRALRLLGPFAAVWLFSLLLARAREAPPLDVQGFALRLPYAGPGNYFVPVALALAVLGPLLHAAYRAAPLPTLLVAVAADLGFELWAAGETVFSRFPYLYSAAFPRYLAAFAFGLWLADDRVRPWARAVSAAVLGTASAVYLYAANAGLLSVPFRPDWRTQNLLAVGYPVALVLAGMLLLPRSSRSAPVLALAELGRWSYHLFLAQMMWFAITGQSKSDYLWVNLVAVVVLGAGMAAIDMWRRTCGLPERLPASDL